MVINTINTRKYINLYNSCKTKDSRPTMIIFLTFLVINIPQPQSSNEKSSHDNKNVKYLQIRCRCVVNMIVGSRVKSKFSRKLESCKLDCIIKIQS